MSSELRILVDDLVSDLDANPLDMHPQRLEELARIAPHSISPLRSPELLEKYNCVMHAFELVGKMTEYPHPLRFASTQFVSYLVTRALRPCEPQRDALVTWSSEGTIKHVGRLIDPVRAESKWGLGILCAHGLDEIPLRYGEVSGFYGAMDADSVLEHLRRFIFDKQA
jgi:hypothetical protein